MRTLNRNKQQMYYSLFLAEKEIYVLDDDGNRILDYTDDDGIVYYRTEKRAMYSKPVKFYGNIAMSGGEARMVEYGLNQADYEAKLVVDKGLLPIDETSRIWYENEPIIKDYGYWVYGEETMTYQELVNEYSADYTVTKKIPSLNNDVYALKKIVK